ncbi:restriction endonuclease subunit S [Acinetobacter nosocomialis]|uniref:restriction endonuclease subunit S n=1 Tax=Acinetobacter nosocomialis TaxID=106654 RepID=UPI0025A9C9A1|nr:restriction endonuclease subunit S [Acinetobacter nosocomialis]MDM9636710.1 restriction endonuclease subunit S [Acinetobacter nosocomialis]
MNWQQVKLGEIFEIARGGSPRPIDQYITDDPNGLNWISIKDASNSSKYIYKTEKKIKPEGLHKTRLVHPDDFLLTNSMSFGRPYIMKTTGCIHDGWLVLSADKSRVDTDYFYHLLGSDFMYRKFAGLAAGAVVKNLNTELVKSISVPLPPLTEQRRIASILDNADELRQKRQQAIEKLDQLLHSTFIDMFGDPVSNPKEWKIDSLNNYGSYKNGLNFGKGETGNQVLYIGVGDFKQLSKIDDISKLSTIQLNQLPSDDYFIKDGDLLFVRSNGNKELVGRCVVVYPKGKQITYSGFCIRYRVEKLELTGPYLVHLFRTKSFKQTIFDAGQGANIQNINQQLLSQLKIPVPPKDLQEKWAEILLSLEDQKQRLYKQLDIQNQLFSSLQNQAFSGTL